MIISILDFIKTGNFGNVYLGQSASDIRKIFHKPDDVSDMGHNTTIWRYGAFEFHFSEDILFLLWCDNLNFMYSPRKKQFKLNRWILDKYEKFTLRKFMEALELEKIKYNLKGTFYTSELPDNVILNVVDTDICVYFENHDKEYNDIYDYELVAIGASTHKSNYKVRPL